jgi:isoleucyl-tRNA synthetase
MSNQYPEFNGLHLPTIEAEILAAWKKEQAFEQSVQLLSLIHI